MQPLVASNRRGRSVRFGDCICARRSLTYAVLRLAFAIALLAGARAVEAHATLQRDTVIREPFDARSVGSAADRCANFFAYANGGHETAFFSGKLDPRAIDAVLDVRTDNIVHQILVTAEHGAGSRTHKLATLYRTCMDDAAIERHGLQPIAAELSAIDAIRRKRDLVSAIARLHDSGVAVAFTFGPGQDYHDSAVTIGEFAQTDLGISTREYYLRSDTAARLLRTQYQAYLSALLAASGERAGAARSAAIIALETRLARASMSIADLHEPHRLDHPMTLATIAALTPHLALRRYLVAEHVAPTGTINVAQPAFFRAVDRAVVDVPLRAWKDYLRSRLLDTFAPALPKRFASPYSAFHAALTGNDGPAPFPRWERCVDSANALLGDTVAAAYVKDAYPATLHSAAVALAVRIKTAFRDELVSRTDLSPRTKRNALAKLDAMRLNIGYPQRRRDYRSYTVGLDSYAANVARGARYEHRWELDTIGRKLDRTFAADPDTLPQTVNADSDLQRNEITVPAAMFARPNFDAAGDDAANLGAMGGGIIGHEMMHGFDDEGAQLDAAGKLRDWWSSHDLAQKRRAERCVMDQYRRIDVGGEHYNGRLIAGEAIADLGGVLVGYRALRSSLARHAGKRIDGFTPEQRYFLAFAQSWGNDLEFDLGPPDQRVLFDEHPLARDRVNATLANVPAWYAAFGCNIPPHPLCDIW